MCAGISIPRRDLPDKLVERHGIQARIVTRGSASDQEVRFLFRDAEPVLPVWHDRNLGIFHWGSNDKKSRLPQTGWCLLETLEAGRWRHLQPEPVDIPACCGWENSRWFQIEQGIRGILVGDVHGCPHVYMLTEPATHYYRIMTRCERMPALIDQTL